MMIERRVVARERIFQRAHLVFNGRQSMFACAIRSWSPAGAMVRLSDWTDLPAAFEIAVAGWEDSVCVRQCWRRGDDVGIAFLTAAEVETAPVISLAQERDRRSGARTRED